MICYKQIHVLYLYIISFVHRQVVFCLMLILVMGDEIVFKPRL